MEKVQISDKMCEEHVIGELIGRKGAYFEVADILDDECFYQSRLREIWCVVKELASKGEDIDLITIYAELSKKGSATTPLDLADLSEKFYLGNLLKLAYRLRELRDRRRLYALGLKMQSAGVSETETVEEIVTQMSNGS